MNSSIETVRAALHYDYYLHLIAAENKDRDERIKKHNINPGDYFEEVESFDFYPEAAVSVLQWSEKRCRSMLINLDVGLLPFSKRGHFISLLAENYIWMDEVKEELLEENPEEVLSEMYLNFIDGILECLPDSEINKPETPINLDFIQDKQLSASLENDSKEMIRSIETETWKASIVLGGSIVEAILAYSLGVWSQGKPLHRPSIETLPQLQKSQWWDYWKKENNKPCNTVNQCRFSDLIVYAYAHELISKPIAEDCFRIKDYRNTIHSGQKRTDKLDGIKIGRGMAHQCYGAIINLSELLKDKINIIKAGQ